MDEYVKSNTEHGITTIEFFNPRGNSLPGNMLKSLANEIHYAGNHDANVIILKSGGEGAFCGGASFEELASVKNTEDGTKFFLGFANVINAMRQCNKLIIARVQGKCVGGGVGLAAAADYAIAVNKAEIKLSELAIGIGPFVIGPAVERKIGASAFSQIAIDATMWRNADWGKRKGLFAEVHESVKNMDDSIYRLSNELAHTSTKAMHELKRIFWAGTDHWNELLEARARISGQLVTTEEAQKAIAAVQSKSKR